MHFVKKTIIQKREDFEKKLENFDTILLYTQQQRKDLQ